MVAERLTILFSGMIAADPFQGGATWAVLQYLLGLRRLGHDVFFVEPLQPGALRPALPRRATLSLEALAGSASAAYFRQVVADFGLEDCTALLLADTRQTVGMSYE